MLNFTHILFKVNDALFSKNVKCIYCNKELNENSRNCFCENCLKRLIYNHKIKCKQCGNYVYTTTNVCKLCEIDDKHFDYFSSAFAYKGIIRSMVKQLKFCNKRYIGEFLGKFMLEVYLDLNFRCDVAIPIPLYKDAQRKRGFNHANELCKPFKEFLPVYKNILIKTKNTKEQARLSYQDRQNNLRNCFTVKSPKKIKGKSILLIDDVFTTGSTANECSRILKKFGAGKIFVLTLCC